MKDQRRNLLRVLQHLGFGRVRILALLARSSLCFCLRILVLALNITDESIDKSTQLVAHLGH